MQRTPFAAAAVFVLAACTSENTTPIMPTAPSFAQVVTAGKVTNAPLQTTIDDAFVGTLLHSDGATYIDGVCGVSDLQAGGVGAQLRTSANWNSRLGCAKRYFTVQMPSWTASAAASELHFPDLTTGASGKSRAQMNLGLTNCLLLRFGWTARDNADSVSFSFNSINSTWTVTSSGRGTCWMSDGHGGQFPTGENAIVPFRVTVSKL